jgi:PadR family transcriptional regulator PadR
MDLERELLKGNSPMLVLAVLAQEPLHGYAIAREIERRSQGALRCREGTLYPVLHSLERDGLVAATWERAANGRERRVYCLTEAGAAALLERQNAWERFTQGVRQVVDGVTPAPGQQPEPAG